MIVKEGKFKPGETVLERIRPNQQLTVTQYAADIYYCKVMENPTRKELVYFERELRAYTHFSK